MCAGWRGSMKMRPDSFVDLPGTPHAAERLGHGQARLQAVLVKAGAEIGAAEPGVPLALQRPEPALRAYRRSVKDRMIVGLRRADDARDRARAAD